MTATMSSWWPVILARTDRSVVTADPRVLWTTLILVDVLLLGALVFAVLGRWRKRSRQDRPDTGDQLTHFRSLYERGQLSREEFEQIRAKLGAKLRKEMKVPVKADAAAGSPLAPAEPSPASSEPPDANPAN